MRMLAGKQALRDIYAQTGAEIVSSTPWTQYLAEEISAATKTVEPEAENGNNA